MTYKDALYRSYVSTHIADRKGSATLRDMPKRARVFDQHFRTFLPRDRSARIADLGCGPGTLLWWLQQRGFADAQGVDASPEQIAAAHDLGVAFAQEGDIFAFLKDQPAFDLLFARDVIEHFDKQAVFDLLAAALAGLKPGGRLVLQVPNGASPYAGRVRYGDFTHELSFTSGSMAQLLLAIGYTDVSVGPWRPGISGLKSRLRHMGWRLIEPLLKLPAYLETGDGGIVTMNLIVSARKPE